MLGEKELNRWITSKFTSKTVSKFKNFILKLIYSIFEIRTNSYPSNVYFAIYESINIQIFLFLNLIEIRWKFKDYLILKI